LSINSLKMARLGAENCWSWYIILIVFGVQLYFILISAVVHGMYGNAQSEHRNIYVVLN
jgi:hypothetical protein